MSDDFIPLKPYRAFPSLPAVGGDLNSHSTVLREIREGIEQHERRRGDPLDSFVRIRELISVGVLAQLGDRVVAAADTIFGGSVETEFVQDTIGTILLDSGSINFTYNDSAPSITATVIAAGVDHNSLANYDANEHVDHTAVTLTAGTGLTGGGDISANRSFALDMSVLASLALADSAVQPGDLATVAFSGDYADLINTPADLSGLTFLTEDDETAALPNSRQLLAGTNVSFDDSVSGERTVNVTAPETDIQIFTADGTWNKPAGAKLVEVFIAGGGGGGGGGGKTAAVNASGGGGGGGGSTLRLKFDAADLSASEAVVVGVGGNGGAGATVTAATAGTSGGNSSFAGHTAYGGGVGARGSNPFTANGGGGAGLLAAGDPGGGNGVSGGAAVAGGGQAGTANSAQIITTAYYGVGLGGTGCGGATMTGGNALPAHPGYGSNGGGNGGGISNAGAHQAGSNGGGVPGQLTQAAFGAAGGGNGTNALDNLSLIAGGASGGGGGGNTAGNGGNGGNGGKYGGGGGGGGGSIAGNGGNGGNGGAGVVVVTTYF